MVYYITEKCYKDLVEFTKMRYRIIKQFKKFYIEYRTTSGSFVKLLNGDLSYACFKTYQEALNSINRVNGEIDDNWF